MTAGADGGIRGEKGEIELIQRVEAIERRLQLLDDARALLGDLRRLHPQIRDEADAAVRARFNLVLGRAALRAGAFRDAARALEQLNDPDDDVIADLALAYNLCGDTARSVEFLRCTLDQLDRPGRELSYIRIGVLLSCALTDLGNIAAAHDVLQVVDARGASVELDLISRVRLHWGGARLADATGQPLLALLRIQRAIAELRRTDDTRRLGRAYLRAGEFAGAAERWTDAEENLDLAGRLLGADADVIDIVILYCELGRVAAHTGRGEEGEAWARSALARLGHEEPYEQGRARWVLAVALVAQGRVADSLPLFELADRALAPTMRYTARVRRDWANALELHGNLEEAASLRSRADAIDRVRRLPEGTEALLRELEDGQSAQRDALDELESRVAAAELALGVPPQTGRPERHLRLVQRTA